MGGVLALSRIGRLSPFRARETARDTWVALTGKPLVRRLRTAACDEGVGPPFFLPSIAKRCVLRVEHPSSSARQPSPMRRVFAAKRARSTRGSGNISFRALPRLVATKHRSRAPRGRAPSGHFPFAFFSGLLPVKVPAWRRGKERRGSCPAPPQLWLRRPIPRPRTDPSRFLTRRVNRASSNPASFGLDTGDASDLRHRRLTPRDFRHPRGSPTRLFETVLTVRVPARPKV